MLNEGDILMAQYIFRRVEKKYIISKNELNLLLDKISNHTIPDKYGECDVCNIYCDTSDFRIIRASILKPKYKEKLRLRCYGTPTSNSKCFLEIKKKYKGVVYKRRVKAEYLNALNFINYSDDKIDNCQIKDEIEYFRKINQNPTPSVCVFYRRKAFYDKNDNNIRITFDTNLLFRDYDLDLKNGIYGEEIIPEDKVIMEIKTSGAMPFWLVNILTENNIYPTSFSKYGTAYNIMLKNKLLKSTFSNGGYQYVR